MGRCRGCGSPGSPGALTCSHCGQRHPTGILAPLGGGVLVLFGLAVLVAFAQAFTPRGDPAALSPGSFQEEDRGGGELPDDVDDPGAGVWTGEGALSRGEVGAVTRSRQAAVTWGEVVELARGEAHRGPWRMNRSDFRYVDAPSVDRDDRGRIALVWVDQARKDVFFQMRTGDGTSSPADPVNVSRSSDTFSWLPRVALDPDDPEVVHVLWQEIVFSGGSHGGEIFYARSTDGGRSFSQPANLSRSPAGAGKGRLNEREWHNGSLDLALGPGGDVYVAWTEYEGPLWLRRSEDRGESFQEAVRVGGDERRAPARGPSLAAGPDGTVHLAWTVGEDARADIHLATSTDGGRSFSGPHRPVPTRGHADAPKVAVDGDGVVHLAFGDRPRGPNRTSRILYARSFDGGGSFDEAREVSNPDRGGAAFPHLAAAGGRVHLAWKSFPRPDRRPEGLYYTASGDGGESFSPPTLVPGSGNEDRGFSGGLEGLLMSKLAADSRGEIALVSSTFDPGRESRVRLVPGRVSSP